MTKNKNEEVLESAEVEEVEDRTIPTKEEENQRLIQERSEKIAELLKEEPQMALQPFMNINQLGIRPDVALVILEQKDEETK